MLLLFRIAYNMVPDYGSWMHLAWFIHMVHLYILIKSSMVNHPMSLVVDHVMIGSNAKVRECCYYH